MGEINKSHYQLAHDAIKALLPAIGEDDAYTKGYTDGVEAALHEVERLIERRWQSARDSFISDTVKHMARRDAINGGYDA